MSRVVVYSRERKPPPPPLPHHFHPSSFLIFPNIHHPTLFVNWKSFLRAFFHQKSQAICCTRASCARDRFLRTTQHNTAPSQSFPPPPPPTPHWSVLSRASSNQPMAFMEKVISIVSVCPCQFTTIFNCIVKQNNERINEKDETKRKT